MLRKNISKLLENKNLGFIIYFEVFFLSVKTLQPKKIFLRPLDVLISKFPNHRFVIHKLWTRLEMEKISISSYGSRISSYFIEYIGRFVCSQVAKLLGFTQLPVEDSESPILDPSPYPTHLTTFSASSDCKLQSPRASTNQLQQLAISAFDEAYNNQTR